MVSSGTKRNAALRTALCSTASEPDSLAAPRSPGTLCVASVILRFPLSTYPSRASARLRAFRRLLHALRIGRDLDACALLLEQHHGARVAPLPAAVASLRSTPHRRGCRCASARRPRVPRSVASPTSLCASAARNRRIVLAGQELIEQAVEGAHAAGRALAHRLPQVDRVDPGLDAHREDLGERAADRTALGSCARAWRSSPAPIGPI